MHLAAIPHLLSASVLLLSSALSNVGAATITVPPLYQCEPVNLTIAAEGNFTIEARDNATHKILFREKVDAGVTQVTWTVNLTAADTAWFEVIDQVGTRRSQTTVDNATAVVLDSPTGNTSCLSKNAKAKATTKQKSMVATIIGVCLGVFLLLIIGLVGLMVYRRKKERRQRMDNDSVDDSHRGDYVQPGGGYMAKLVPGLNFHAARPLPRDIELETEQAKYADERRMTRHYTRPTEVSEARTTRETRETRLPTYGQSQRLSRMQQQQRGVTSYNGRQNPDNTYLTDTSFGNQYEGAADTSDPFDSRYEQHPSLYENGQSGWNQSQGAFLPPASRT